jgi:class 3 adenylate cyclase
MDVAGYSRLMGEDEEATIRTLTAYRAVIASLIQQYRGRVVDAPGDNLLAEFASIVDAVRCAVEIQHALKAKNAELPDHRQMQFRIGINLGDVIIEGERLYGDGVNIAARLESLAIPGGICISGTVYDQVENKLPLQYTYQGEQSVKNIAKPVRTYRVVMDDAAAALAEVLSRMGRREEALVAADKALQRKPGIEATHLLNLGIAYALVGRTEEAVTPLKQYLTRYPNILGAHLTLVAVYSKLGKDAEAQAEVAEVLRINPQFSLEVHQQRMPIKDPAVLVQHIAALRKAGLK